MIRIAIVALLALALAPVPEAQASEEGGFTRTVRGNFGTSVNPLGVQNNFDLSWRRPLTQSRHPLLADAHLSLGVSSRLTPAYGRVGAWVEISPLSVLDLQVGVEPTAYFGTFHHLLAYGGYGDAFDDESRKARSGAEGGTAGRLYFAPTLKAKVGRIIVRGHAELEWWKANAPGPFFYEPFRDTLLRSSGDSLVATETLVLWALWDEGPRKLLVGPIHDMTHVFDASQNRRQDVGVVGILGLGALRFHLAEPVVFAKVVRYIESPIRDRKVAAQLAIAFTVGRPR
jgi:hypothetical protein